MSEIFVDREDELKLLNKLFQARLRGANYNVLIYGIRRIGKTYLVDRFVRDKIGFRVDCSSFISGGDLFKAIYANLSELDVSKHFRDVLKSFENLYHRPLDDDFEMIAYSFDLLNSCAEKINYIIVALDEFHSFIENLSSLRLRGGASAKQRLLWLLRDKIMRLRRNIFLIFLTSAGFLFEEYSRADRAFLQLFQRIEIKPLSEEASIEMAEKLLKALEIGYSYEALRTIAKISGGVPKLIEEIVGYMGVEDNINSGTVIKYVERALASGYFDDFFEAYFSFIAETTKWSRATLVKVLRVLAEGIRSPKEISKRTGIKYNTLLNILSDLRKKDIVSQSLEIKYPLLKEWLLSRDLPPTGVKRIDLLRQSLGVAIEYYIRELFKKIDKEITIKGEHYFLGTTEEISIGPIDKVYGGGEIDLIAHQKNCTTIVGEIKIGKISKKELLKFLERAEGIEGRKIYVVIASDAESVALAEMVRKNVIFMNFKTIKEIARRIGFPKIDIA